METLARSLVRGRGKHTQHDSGEASCDSWPRLTVSGALPVRRGTRRLHLASINLLLPWNNAEELPQSSGSDTDIPVKPGEMKLEKLCSCVNSISPEGLQLSGQLKRSGVEKMYRRVYIYVYGDLFSPPLLFPGETLLTQTYSYSASSVRERTICRALHVYPARGNERRPLNCGFCVYVSTPSGGRSEDRREVWSNRSGAQKTWLRVTVGLVRLAATSEADDCWLQPD